MACPCPLVFRRSGLVRELPGTGSKTGAYGTSGAAEVVNFRAAAPPAF
ncbi:hypothetical protein CFN58_27335 [Pseudomonas avellanae]|uniref:Uncharacterized protein n=1 Tax=Pseudomonas avellanae TaxID=46257 RepID=A0A261WD90_9PSED|nr:hypothetical protein CFN58_27335 [Pseudomonas avellanae]PHZ38867.1 hypothetical protein CS297_24570 [Pseudomonas syringae pv. actinidiae]PIB86177.1 hypothetical protein CS296_19715 [Pseudomonas syringae pv. actinidiae]PIH65356.1 hypothetical protein CS298_09505 [Pseudomonas syringae pv. actinidiae]PIH72393.1 hypothetical protein CS299_01485 [Pseudomonas syringae pv. actinidiae]